MLITMTTKTKILIKFAVKCGSKDKDKMCAFVAFYNLKKEHFEIYGFLFSSEEFAGPL